METKQKREKGNAAFVNLPKLRYTIWKRSTILHKRTAVRDTEVSLSSIFVSLSPLTSQYSGIDGFNMRGAPIRTPLLPNLRYTIWKRYRILHKPTASVQLSERRQYLPFIHHSTLVLTGFKGRELTPLSRCEFSFWSTGVQLSERHPYLPSIPYLSPLKHPINIVLKSFRGRWGSQLSLIMPRDTPISFTNLQAYSCPRDGRISPQFLYLLFKHHSTLVLREV